MRDENLIQCPLNSGSPIVIQLSPVRNRQIEIDIDPERERERETSKTATCPPCGHADDDDDDGKVTRYDTRETPLCPQRS